MQNTSVNKLLSLIREEFGIKPQVVFECANVCTDHSLQRLRMTATMIIPADGPISNVAGQEVTAGQIVEQTSPLAFSQSVAAPANGGRRDKPAKTKRAYRKRKDKDEDKPAAGLSRKSISDKDVLQMRTQLAVWRAVGKLGPNQISALDSTKGVHIKSLSDVQRKQIKDIYDNACEGRKE